MDVKELKFVNALPVEVQEATHVIHVTVTHSTSALYAEAMASRDPRGDDVGNATVLEVGVAAPVGNVVGSHAAVAMGREVRHVPSVMVQGSILLLLHNDIRSLSLRWEGIYIQSRICLFRKSE
ncbi:MAG: hypothetical protein Q8R40_03380 [bacterium]|nr:hypothetical protein [bacterium]